MTKLIIAHVGKPFIGIFLMKYHNKITEPVYYINNITAKPNAINFVLLINTHSKQQKTTIACRKGRNVKWIGLHVFIKHYTMWKLLYNFATPHNIKFTKYFLIKKLIPDQHKKALMHIPKLDKFATARGTTVRWL